MRIEIDKQSLANVTKTIVSNVEIALNRTLFETKLEMIDAVSSNIAEFGLDNNPKITNALSKTGLLEYTLQTSGNLRKGMYRTIDNISLNKKSITVFSETFLNEDTPWVGLSKPPVIFYQQKATLDFRDKDFGIVLGGYRPLPGFGMFSSSKNEEADWQMNPYSGQGYWKIYNDGYGQYRPRRFLENIYSYMLDGDVQSKTVRFSTGFLSRLGYNITKVSGK